ncbi:MAG TPA: beta-galactosidase, partial [Jatrophihabitantaceae bacterium]
MDRRQFLAISALTPAAAMALTKTSAVGAPQRGKHTFGFAPDGSAFLLDGAPFQIRAGEMHPARIPVEYWRHRIRMAKAMGMNTVSLYVMWNYLEERERVFD